MKVRELTSARIGKLLRITGQVVRTHPVHPELVLATFKCADCQTIIPDVEQQFKYTQVPLIAVNCYLKPLIVKATLKYACKIYIFSLH